MARKTKKATKRKAVVKVKVRKLTVTRGKSSKSSRKKSRTFVDGSSMDGLNFSL